MNYLNDINKYMLTAEGGQLSISDYKSLIKKKDLPGAESINIKDIIKTVSHNKKNIIPFGSWTYKSQQYPGDIDLIEIEEECCNVKEATKKFVTITKKIVRNILKKRGYYVGDIKAGLDNRYKIYIGDSSYDGNGNFKLKNYDQKKVLYQLSLLYKSKLLSKSEYDQMSSMLTPSLTQLQYETLYDLLREKYILRWSAKEILQGYKILPGNIKYTLGEAINDPTMTKIDLWTNLNGKFIEVSNVLTFFMKNKKQRILINFMNDIATLSDQLKEEVQKYAYSINNYKPFKMVKRMWSIARMSGDMKMIKLLTPVMQSDLGRLSQINSEIETLILILQNIKAPPMASIYKQIDGFKYRLQNVYEIELNTELIDKTIDGLTKIQSDKKAKRLRLIKVLKGLKKYFKSLIDEYTIAELKNIGLIPLPRNYLP